MLSFISGSWGARSQAVAGLVQRRAAMSAAAGGWVGSGGVGPPRQPAPGSAPIPLVRWVAMYSSGGVAGAPSATPEARAQPPAVLVKVGATGHYLVVKFPQVMDMDVASLLKALRLDDAFATKMAGVALDECTVQVCASASDEEPLAPEAASSRQLKGTKMLGALVASIVATLPGANLFVHVHLPHAVTNPVAGATAPHSANMLASARALLEALRAAKPEAMPGSKSGASLLRLPPGVRWPQLADAPLFVRHFYRDCFEGPLEALQPGGRYTIIGNAGIGKSAFGLYLLWQAVREGRTTVYISDKAVGCTIFHADGQAEIRDKAAFTDVLPELREPSTVLIYDGNGEGKGSPPHVPATTVLITSPKRSRFSEFEKEGGDLMFFPVFTRAEIADLLEAAFPALHSPEGRTGVWERYDRWGGIPRYVLKRITAAAQRRLPGALTNLRFDKLAMVLGHEEDEGVFFEDDSSISHRLFHLKPRGETDNGFVGGATADAYLLHRTEMASPVVKEMVYAAMLKQRSEELNKLLALPTTNPSVAKFIADAFETHALHALSSGGSFEAFNPAGNVQVTLSFQPSERRFFSDVEDLRDAAAAANASKSPITFIPKAKNFASIDAVLPGNTLVNATLDRQHKLLMQGKSDTNGVVPICDALGIGGPATFVWAVPHDRFEDLCRKGKPAALVVKRESRVQPVQQFFVRVPPPPWAGAGEGSAAGKPPRQ